MFPFWSDELRDLVIDTAIDPTKLMPPTVNQAIHFIEKLEACSSMSAKLVLLRGFCEKYAAGPLREWADKHADLPQHLWTEERRQFEADRQSKTGSMV